MKSSLLMNFTADKQNNRVMVEREFQAPLDSVWAAWTEAGLLDQWWAPLPWKTRTKEMDFRAGGHWLYAMVGPEGETHWCRADYQSVAPRESFSARDAFCDEEGNVNTSFPRSTWTNRFSKSETGTMVRIQIQYDSLNDLEKIIEMGFKEGFTMALENLDRMLEKG